MNNCSLHHAKGQRSRLGSHASHRLFVDSEVPRMRTAVPMEFRRNSVRAGGYLHSVHVASLTGRALCRQFQRGGAPGSVQRGPEWAPQQQAKEGAVQWHSSLLSSCAGCLSRTLARGTSEYEEVLQRICSRNQPHQAAEASQGHNHRHGCFDIDFVRVARLGIASELLQEIGGL